MGDNRYTDGSTREISDYAISTGRPTTEVAKGPGPNDKTVNDWVLRRKEPQGPAPGPKAEDRGLREAKRRIRGLEIKNGFLKEAAAFFAKGQRL